MALPTLSPEQRAEALQKAQAARQARKQLLEQVKSGEATIAQVIERAKDDPIVAKTRVGQVVLALPGYGPAKVAAVLNDAGIADGRRVAGLGAKQHEALISALS